MFCCSERSIILFGDLLAAVYSAKFLTNSAAACKWEGSGVLLVLEEDMIELTVR